MALEKDPYAGPDFASQPYMDWLSQRIRKMGGAMHVLEIREPLTKQTKAAQIPARPAAPKP
jgi:hypothetical protein